MTSNTSHSHQSDKQDDLEDLFENSLNGYVSATADGAIVRVNHVIASWLCRKPNDLVGARFADFLTIGGKVLYETHLSPLLRMQGYFDEVAVELSTAHGERIPVFVNAIERRDADGNAKSVWLTVFKGIDRRIYEENLLQAKKRAEVNLLNERETSALREQFIAVLSHDLRNPLGAIDGGSRLLLKTPLNERAKSLVEMILSSTARMGDLINDVMDFARGRLGSGISVDRKNVLMGPILNHVVEELRTGKGGREIKADIKLPSPVNCDPTRISQLLSNLLANALTHGAKDGTVNVIALCVESSFKLSVSNSGNPIPVESLQRIFEPFTRNEERPSKQGLGLGLYIAAQIAEAHGGKLQAESSNEQTCFTFRMPVAQNNGSD